MNSIMFIRFTSLFLLYFGFTMQQTTPSDGSLNNAQTICSLFLNNKCFVFVNTLYTFDNAEANCVSLGGHLTSVHSAAENTGIRNLYTSGKAWIGMREDATNNQEWVDGTAVSYTSWYTGQPNSNSEDCGAFWSSNSLWWDRPCSDTYYSICLIHLNTPQLTCSLLLNSACFILVRTPYSFANAEVNCVSIGGHLTSVHSAEEDTGIRNLYSSSSLWIGMHEDASNNQEWSDGRPVSYTNWASTQPNSNTDDCGAYYLSYSDWWDRPCSETYFSICRIQIPDPVQGDVRLYGSNEPHTGILQVYYNGVWGYVCDDLWGTNDAKVVCRQLGFSGLISTQGGVYAPSTLYWLDSVGCTGSEENISVCSHLGWGIHNCYTNDHVNVTCILDKQGDVRLYGSNEPHTGILQVYYNGVWGYVCDYLWGTNDAKVVCRQLGFAGVSSTQGGIYAPSTLYWLDSVGCTGSEENISVCSHLGWGNHYCYTNDHVNVTCIPADPVQGDVRLYGSNEPHTGILQVYYNGVWGYVCDDAWGTNDAKVVCRQLGFSGLISTQGGVYAPSTFYWLDNVGCTGSEENISVCSHLGWGNHNCYTNEHVNVTCILGSSTLSTGAIVGIAVGIRFILITIAVILLIGVVIYIIKHRTNTSYQKETISDREE